MGVIRQIRCKFVQKLVGSGSRSVLESVTVIPNVWGGCVYNGPALKIRLGINSIDVLPVGRYAIGPLSLELLKGIPGNAQRWGDLSGGRVDITNGERRHLLLRSIEDGQDHWYTVGEPLSPAAFDRKRLEEIVQNLLS